MPQGPKRPPQAGPRMLQDDPRWDPKKPKPQMLCKLFPTSQAGLMFSQDTPRRPLPWKIVCTVEKTVEKTVALWKNRP